MLHKRIAGRVIALLGRNRFWIILLSLGLSFRAADAAQISGQIAATMTITEDSQLVGDVTCTVSGAPCIVLASPGITLKLNGFTMTGQGDAATGCTGAAISGEIGIVVAANQIGIVIRGPGIVQQFRSAGILLSGAINATVTRVTTAVNCTSGILVAGGSYNEVSDNISIRNGNLHNPCGGVCLAGSSHNRVHNNRVGGNGYANQPNNFGIGMPSPADTDNTIENNEIL